jgi:hypothetical protein
MIDGTFATSCFVRYERGSRWKYGNITVTRDNIVWKPFWSIHKTTTFLATKSVGVQGVYEAIGEHGGANIKEYLFKAAECRFDDSDSIVELAVPRKHIDQPA